MANVITTEITLDLDTLKAQLKGAEELGAKSGHKMGKDFGDGAEQGIGSTIDSIKDKFKLLAEGFAVFEGIKASVEMVKIAEEAIRINEQFDVLAERAGLAGSVLEESLKKASGGLIDETELLKAASRGMVELGANAKRLPEIMEVARKATALFGGSLVENFEAMNLAIATGHTRQLRNLGLVIDQEKAYKEFAKSVGVSANALSAAGRQQAILNAVMESQKGAFAGVNKDLGEGTNAFARLTVSTKEFIETISRMFNTVFGPAITKATNVMSDMLNSTSRYIKMGFGTEVEKNAIKLEGLNSQLKYHTGHLEDLNARAAGGALSPKVLAQINDGIAGETKHIAELTAKIKDLTAAQSEGGGGPNAPKPKMFDPAKAAAEQAEFQKVMNAAAAEALNTQIAAEQQEGIRNQLRQQQIMLTETDHQNKIRELKLKYLDTGMADKARFAKLETAMDQTRAAKVHQIQNQINAQQLAFTKTFQMGMVTTMSQGFAAFGQAIATGADLFAAFGKAVLSSFGQVLIQLGTQTVAVGLLMSTVPVVFGLQGAAAVFAGLGMIVAGGILTGLASGGGGAGAAPGGGASGGGVAAAGGGLTAPVVDTGQQQTAAAPKEIGTHVTVNVHGNILDRRQTGLELADVINEAFGSNGVVFATPR